MKKVLSVLVGATVLLGFAGSVFAAPFDDIRTYLDVSGTATTTQAVTPFATTLGSNSIEVFVGDDSAPAFRSFNIGSGIAVNTSSNNIYVTPNTIETTDGFLTDTLNLKASTASLSALSSSLSSLSSAVSALGPALNIAAFMGSNGSTSPFIASSTQNGFMSAAMAIKVSALTTRSMATSTRSIVTGTGATGFQVSSTRDAEVRYSTTIVTTSNIAGSQNGTVVLEIAPTNSVTASDWSEIGRCTNGTSYTLAIAIQGVSTQACQITGYVPSGYYAKIRSINNAGTPTFSFNSSQEVLQ